MERFRQRVSDWEVKDKVWQTPFTFSSAGNRLVALPDHTHSSLIRVSEGFLQQVKRAMASRPKYCFFPKGILHGRYGLERESFPPVPIPAYRIMCLSDFRPTDISQDQYRALACYDIWKTGDSISCELGRDFVGLWTTKLITRVRLTHIKPISSALARSQSHLRAKQLGKANRNSDRPPQPLLRSTKGIPSF